MRIDFNTLVKRHRTGLHALATQIVGDPDEADDLVQDALMTALDAQERFDPGRGSPEGWVRGILRNMARWRLGSVRSTPLGYDIARLAAPASKERAEARSFDALLEDCRHRLDHLLPYLAAREKAAVILKLQGYSRGEIAGHMNIVPSTVTTYLSEATARLRSLNTLVPDAMPKKQPDTRPASIRAAEQNFKKGYRLIVRTPDHASGQGACFARKLGSSDTLCCTYEEALNIFGALGESRPDSFIFLPPRAARAALKGDGASGSIPIVGVAETLGDQPEALSAFAPPTEREARFMMITPRIARSMLDRNVSNRPLRKSHVRRYAKLMREGRWHVTSDAIAFSTEGRLLNGQHRLGAVVQSGTAQKMLICTGLDPEVFQFLDYGKKRTLSDALAIKGYTSVSALASGAKLVYMWQTGALGQRQVRAEPDELLALVEQYADLTDAVNLATRHRAGLRKLAPHSNVIFIYWAFARGTSAEMERIADFVEKLSTGVGILDLKEPVALLRQRLFDNATSDARLPPATVLGLIIRAANLHVHERQGRLSWGEGAFPEPDVSWTFDD